MPDHFEELPPQASTGTEGQVMSSPAGRVIAAINADSTISLAQASLDGAIMHGDPVTHALLAHILLAIEKSNIHLAQISDLDVTDEDVI